MSIQFDLLFRHLTFKSYYSFVNIKYQFKYLIKFAKNCKFNSDFPLGKMLGKFLMEKPSPPLRNLVIFSKKMMKKTMISAVKTIKKFKNIECPKMVSKRLYGHYLRSYEQIKNFQI